MPEFLVGRIAFGGPGNPNGGEFTITGGTGLSVVTLEKRVTELEEMRDRLQADNSRLIEENRALKNPEQQKGFITVPYHQWEFFGDNPYPQDCAHCREIIPKHGQCWFVRDAHKTYRRALALHRHCYDALGGPGIPSPLFNEVGA